MNDGTERRATGGTGGGYLAVVGGLLLVIVVALAVLWLRERSRRIAAEADAAWLSRRMEGQRMLGQIAGLGGGETGPAIRRRDYRIEAASIQGRDRPVFVLSPQAADRLGLAPGDVLIAPAELDANVRAPRVDGNRAPAGIEGNGLSPGASRP